MCAIFKHVARRRSELVQANAHWNPLREEDCLLDVPVSQRAFARSILLDDCRCCCCCAINEVKTFPPAARNKVTLARQRPINRTQKPPLVVVQVSPRRLPVADQVLTSKHRRKAGRPAPLVALSRCRAQKGVKSNSTTSLAHCVR